MTTATETTQTAPGALRGVRGLDFGHYIPGRLLGMLLSDQDAEVIKNGPRATLPARGKRFVSLT